VRTLLCRVPSAGSGVMRPNQTSSHSTGLEKRAKGGPAEEIRRLLHDHPPAAFDTLAFGKRLGEIIDAATRTIHMRRSWAGRDRRFGADQVQHL
jgi:hypothetical protein